MGATLLESTRVGKSFFAGFGIAGQVPWLDDNGDGNANGLDGFGMGRHRFGKSWAYAGHGTGEVRVFDEVFPPENQTITVSPGTPVELWVTLEPDAAPEAVWALVRPPAPERIAGIPISSTDAARQISLTQDSENPRLWKGLTLPVAEEGLYVVSYIARFGYDRLSRPKVVGFQVKERIDEESRIQQKAFLVAGGGDWQSLAQEMVEYAQRVGNKRGYGSIRKMTFPLAREALLTALREEGTLGQAGGPVRLLVYLIGEAAPGGEFLLNGTERLKPSELIATLNELQASDELLQVILLVDCPYAGEYVRLNAGGPPGRRVVMAGCRPEEKGFFLQGEDGQLSFSRQVLSAGYQGHSLRESFQGAVSLLQHLLKKSSPQLDDTGDGIWNKQDGQTAARWHVGRRGVLAGPGAAALPTLLQASVFPDPVSGDLPVWVDLLDAAAPDRVWVTIIPEAADLLSPAEYPQVELTRAGELWRWSGVLASTLFRGEGNYSLLYRASYGGSRLSEPLVKPVQIASTAVTHWELW
jgi:hypothetical protein